MVESEPLPPTIIPTEAKTERARKFWKMHPIRRAMSLIRPSDETVREYTVSMLESYTTHQLQTAISHHWDITPLVRQKARLDHSAIGPIASKLIYLNWDQIWPVLSHPGSIPEMIAANDPDKAAVLSSPEGRVWLDWVCWQLAVMLSYHGHIDMKGRRILPPPGKNPLVNPPSNAAMLALPPGRG